MASAALRTWGLTALEEPHAERRAARGDFGSTHHGLGYVIWYRALRSLLPVEAALLQLSVPILTALAGVWLMHEPLTARLAISGTLILVGIAWAIRR